MTPRLLALISVLLLLSAPAQAARRASVLLIPLDRGAYAPSAQLTEYLESSIDRNAAYRLRAASEVLGDPTPTSALEARKRVLTAVNEGKKLLAAGQYDEAEASFRSGLVDVDNAAAAMERCGELCEALVNLAAVQLIKGEEQGARDALGELLAIDRGFKFEGPAFGKSFKILYRDLQRESAQEGRLGAVSVQSTPPGGRIYLDGQYKGYAPLTIERVPVGKHLLRIERPGFVTAGQLVEVNGPDAITVKPRLNATNDFADLEGTLDSIVEELERGQGDKNLMKLGAKLKVERALIGTVRTNGQRIRLELVLVDFAARKKLARKVRVFEGDEYGELSKEVQRFGNTVIAAADTAPDPTVKSTSKDPLDQYSGTEDWDEESGSGGDQSQPRAPKGNAPEGAQPGGDW